MSYIFNSPVLPFRSNRSLDYIVSASVFLFLLHFHRELAPRGLCLHWRIYQYSLLYMYTVLDSFCCLVSLSSFWFGISNLTFCPLIILLFSCLEQVNLLSTQIYLFSLSLTLIFRAGERSYDPVSFLYVLLPLALKIHLLNNIFFKAIRVVCETQLLLQIGLALDLLMVPWCLPV